MVTLLFLLPFLRAAAVKFVLFLLVLTIPYSVNCIGPILINGGSWVVFSARLVPTPLSVRETIGTIIGLVGALIMLVDTAKTANPSGAHQIYHQKPTLEGDMVALLGAATVSVYLVIGRHLRAWMPLWIYTFPVIGVAYLTSLGLLFLLGEQPSVMGIFGFLQLPFLPFALYLGARPGMSGHVILNYLVKYLPPLMIATAMLSEPLVGSLLGYILGMQGVPMLCTWIGGSVLLIGLYLIVLGKQEKPSSEEQVSTTLPDTIVPPAVSSSSTTTRQTSTKTLVKK